MFYLIFSLKTIQINLYCLNHLTLKFTALNFLPLPPKKLWQIVPFGYERSWVYLGVKWSEFREKSVILDLGKSAKSKRITAHLNLSRHSKIVPDFQKVVFCQIIR